MKSKKIELKENLNLLDKIICSHCHLEFNKDVMIEDGKHYFCCNGCKGVFHLLSDEGLESFYDKTGDTKLSAPATQYEDSSNFNAPAFYDKFVKINNDGLYEVSLIIEGIHCSACVWLNEKALHKMDGIIEADINFTNNKANIVWQDEVLKLSQIVDMIRAVGYNAYPYDASLQEIHANKERKDYYLRMAVAIFASMNIMWIAVAQYAGFFSGMTQEIKTILNIAEGALATPVLFYSGWIFFRGAYYGLKNRVVNMDLLVASGASLTYVYSLYITITKHGEAYFDSVSMIITFVLIGKFLEVLSKKNAADALDIIGRHLPSEVNILQDKKIISCKLEDVSVGSTVVVSSGEKVLFDGEIIRGEGSFDESNLTGENEPLFKKVGDNVISGTTSIDADIHYRASKDFEHSTLSNLVSLLENAINKKPKIEILANKLSEHFSTVVLLLAIATFFIWWFWPHSLEESLMVGVSVIIIACPCALGLATPVATLVGLHLGIKKGILFKESSQLETMAKTTTLLIDKTGTLTQGKPSVVGEHIVKDFDRNLLFSLVKSSQHPVSQGILHYFQEKYDNKEVLYDSFIQVPARGIKASYKGLEVLGGNSQFMCDNGIEHNFSSDNTLFFLAINREIFAMYELSDEIKDGAKKLIEYLKEKNIETIMLTGDHERSAKKVAKLIGIEKVYAELSPEDKLTFVQRIQENDNIVVMVGDGVNDILALWAADIGIVMSSGSDIAVDVGDVVLLNNSLASLLSAFKISTTTFSLIKQNFGISLVYNAVTIPLAMFGYIIPLIAALSMSFSSLLVVGNSLRIKYYRS
ncbi:cadmium-translocating P-type ATPase [Sulfurimonas sp. SAG-AH-194-C20]|nr:heavy metal translocating P-type ATPase [Sulfurimonas sp. SAG-AH-194-C20]MDF1879341.1 cadmium-translocating P-type ATPase [Sulfurimonas sp. SAG-AH-194-C20]